MATNANVSAMLDELITLTTLEEESPQSFKVRAYENAKLGIEAHGQDITELSAAQLTKIKGVGKSTAAKIREYLETGTVEKLDKLRTKYPPAFVELSKIPGLGPKTLKLVRSELGVEDVEGLRQAIAEEKLRELPRMGATSEAKIAKAIERLGLTGKDRRTPIADALPLAKRLVADLSALPEVAEVEYCGSLRRMSETIGDIDITVASKKPQAVMAALVDHGEVAEIVLSGDTKTSFLTAWRTPGRRPGRRPVTVRCRHPLLHRLQGPQHRPPAAGHRPGPAAQRVRAAAGRRGCGIEDRAVDLRGPRPGVHPTTDAGGHR